MMNKWTMEMTWKTLYNVRNPPYENDRKNSKGKQKENYYSITMIKFLKTTI